jgi:hypothetical protein
VAPGGLDSEDSEADEVGDGVALGLALIGGVGIGSDGSGSLGSGNNELGLGSGNNELGLGSGNNELGLGSGNNELGLGVGDGVGAGDGVGVGDALGVGLGVADPWVTVIVTRGTPRSADPPQFWSSYARPLQLQMPTWRGRARTVKRTDWRNVIRSPPSTARAVTTVPAWLATHSFPLGEETMLVASMVNFAVVSTRIQPIRVRSSWLVAVRVNVVDWLVGALSGVPVSVQRTTALAIDGTVAARSAATNAAGRRSLLWRMLRPPAVPAATGSVSPHRAAAHPAPSRSRR